MSARPHPLPSRLLVLGGLVAIFVGAFVAAAAWDWVWWEPYNALLPYLAEAVLILLAVVLVAIPRARPFALVPAIAATGLVAGQVLGPSRPVLHQGIGTVTVSLTRPIAVTGSGPATCGTSDDPNELQVSGDSNLRMDIIPNDRGVPSDVDQREHVGVFLTSGDRWRRSLRPDQTAFHMSIGRVEADVLETFLVAGPASTLSVDWTPEAGHARFADLVPEVRPNEPAGTFIDVAGTVEWTCTYDD